MLDTAIETVADGPDRPTVHSDRGAYYRWPGWLSRIDHAGLVRSMSRKACSPDNAACEGFFGRLMNELFYPGRWRSTTIEHFIAEVDSYIRWYKRRADQNLAEFTQSHGVPREPRICNLNQSKVLSAPPRCALMTDHRREYVWLGFIGSSGFYLLVNLECVDLGYSGQICVRSNNIQALS